MRMTSEKEAAETCMHFYDRLPVEIRQVIAGLGSPIVNTHRLWQTYEILTYQHGSKEVAIQLVCQRLRMFDSQDASMWGKVPSPCFLAGVDPLYEEPGVERAPRRRRIR